MAKSKDKTRQGWTVLLWGGMAAMWLYLAGILLLALLLVKGYVPEWVERVVLYGLGFAAAAVGGGVMSGRSELAAFPATMLSTAVFLVSVVLVGAVMWPETFWSERCVIPVCAVLAGGIFSGMWCARRGKRRKNVRRHGARK